MRWPRTARTYRARLERSAILCPIELNEQLINWIVRDMPELDGVVSQV
jgi:hypothetical protein